MSAAPARVQRWKNALLDLTLRNRLINMSPRQAVGLAVPDGTDSAASRTWSTGPRRSVCCRSTGSTRSSGARTVTSPAGSCRPASGPNSSAGPRPAVFCDVPAAAYPARWRSLAYKARTIVEETGANNLYLALGSLIWSHRGPAPALPADSRPGAAEADEPRRALPLRPGRGGASVPNFCLLEKLTRSTGCGFPSLAEPAEDESGIDWPRPSAPSDWRSARPACPTASRRRRPVDLPVREVPTVEGPGRELGRSSRKRPRPAPVGEPDRRLRRSAFRPA